MDEKEKRGKGEAAVVIYKSERLPEMNARVTIGDRGTSPVGKI